MCALVTGVQTCALPICTFAEYIAVDAADLALKPANQSMEEAASIPLVALTAWQVLVDTARLRAGQKVLIHAGRSEEHTSELQSLMRPSYAGFCLKKKRSYNLHVRT